MQNMWVKTLQSVEYKNIQQTSLTRINLKLVRLCEVFHLSNGGLRTQTNKLLVSLFFRLIKK